MLCPEYKEKGLARTRRWKHEIKEYFGPEIAARADFYQNIYPEKDS